MKYIATLTDQDVFQKIEFEKPESFQKRTTVKAIVMNDSRMFGFVTNSIHGFYLLAGGGAESENLNEEIIRECEEEINFEVEVIKKIGEIHEYRNREVREYETVCFLVKTLSKSPGDTRTEDERKNGMDVVWLDKDEAIKKLHEQVEKVKNGDIGFYNTAFNIIRDNLFFEEYLAQENIR